MTNKTFPVVEPPPHPESNNASPQLDPKLAGVMVPPPEPQQAGAGYIDPNQVKQSNPGVQQVVNYVPKKGIPKPLIFALGGLLLIILIFVVVVMLKGRGEGNLVGTKGEITWWGIQNEENVVAPLIEEYQNANPGVKISYVKQSPQDYRERLTNALASGNGPDIFEMHNSWVPMFRNSLSSLPDGVLRKDDYTKAYYPVVNVDFNTANGIVAIPLEYDALTLYINDSIFSSSLKSPPKTWDELNQMAKELTQKPKNVIIQAGVGLGLTQNVEYWPEIIGLMMVQNGVNLGKPEGAQVKYALAYYAHFTTEDKIWDSTQPLSGTAFAKGKLAMYFAPSANAKGIVESNPSLRFRTVPLPQLPKEKPSDPDYSYATYWAQGVWKRSSNSEASWNFLKFMSSPESLQKMNRLRKDAGQPEKIYPRPDMALLQKDDKILGSVVELAPVAKSWYLADKTSDGQTGINFQINKIFADAVDTVTGGRDIDKYLQDLPGQINSVIAKYNTKK